MKRIISFFLALAVLGALWISADAAEVEESSEWVTVPFVTEYTGKTDNKIMIKWDWNDLLTNASTSGADSDLAIASLVLSSEIEIAKNNIEYALNALGFTDVLSDYFESDTENVNAVSQPARTFAHRELNVNGETKHIICAVFRGTRTSADTTTDIKSLQDGFLEAGQNCANSLKAYQSSINGATKDNTILLLTGHSLGASMSSLVACLCDDVAEKSATHTYSMATPNYDTMGLISENYQNVHHYININDAVPTMPANFGKVGDEIKYNYVSLTDAEKVRFDRVYKYLRGTSYDTDDNRVDSLVGEVRQHMGYTYMSFMLCQMTDEEVDSYIAPFELVKDTAKLKGINQYAAGAVKAKAEPCAACTKPNYEFSINKNGKWQTITSDSNTVKINKLSDGKSYAVKVRAVKEINGVTYSGQWSAEQTVKINNLPYKLKAYKPVVKKVRKGNKKITVTAKECKLCKKPSYQFAIKKKGKWVMSKTNSKSITFKKLAKKKTYKVKVRIVKTISGKTYTSKWSANKTVKL